MPDEFNLSDYGAQFAKLRDMYKEAEKLGVHGLMSQLPTTAMAELNDVFEVIVHNTQRILSHVPDYNKIADWEK